MPVTQLSIPRKRRHSEQRTPQQNKTSQHISKRQKRSHPNGSQLSSAFWDNLSKVDLTKRALEELDRRNTQAALSCGLPFLRSHRPITRYVQKKSSQPLTPPVEYLCHCGTSSLKKIKLTARHGGPDLSDLRDVRRTRYTTFNADKILVPRAFEPSKPNDELNPIQFSRFETKIDIHLQDQNLHEHCEHGKHRPIQQEFSTEPC
jgi:hypothetical protein